MVDFNHPMSPDDYYRAKLEAFHKAQARNREELAIKEASVFAPPELTRAQRRRLQRTKHKLGGLRP
jgi:hypothetical protein